METSKKVSAKSQIEAGINHFYNGELDCAITLSAAAEGMLPDTDDPHIFKSLREHPSNKELDCNLVINWLKHSLEPETATISEFEAAIVIARAITKFVAVYHESCGPFEEFLRWGYEAEHLPRLFTD